MGTKTAITPDDLIHMPRPENGKHYELSQGELIIVGNGGGLHELIKRAILKLLYLYESAHPNSGGVFAESQFTIADGARIPDVAFVGREKLASLRMENRAIPFAPDLAIEVISESETSSYSETKVKEYLAGGVAEVWQVYPRLRFVRVHRASGVHDLAESDFLCSPLLPGFSASVAMLFEV